MLIKPDGVQRQLVGEILGRIEAKGLTIAALELKNVGDELASAHYAERHREFVGLHKELKGVARRLHRLASRPTP